MNSDTPRYKLLDKLRGHIPDVLYTKVPVPSFMEKPISMDFLFKNSGIKNTKNSKNHTKKPANSMKVLEGDLSQGRETRFAINGKDLIIDNGSWVIGNIEIGACARAKGRNQGDKFLVSQLVLIKQ